THDQVLGGPTGQIFMGCTFPADPGYCAGIQASALRVAEALRQEGVIGRFGVDFVCRRVGGAWEQAAVEVNLRKGGTTHPYLMLQFLTDGEYDATTGLYRSATGRPCFYHASDNLRDPAFRGLSPDDLVDIAVENGLHFDAAVQQGVVFHLIGALSEHGKLGTVCIGDSRQAASRLYHETVAVLDREARRIHGGAPPLERGNGDAGAPPRFAPGVYRFFAGDTRAAGAHG
ncbi:MAG TPA: peptide ligase PGM1-related protein, partial [Longimicrobiaceae bacterium]